MATVEQLLGVLSRQGSLRAGDLAAQLGVSQPTLSRLIAAAGEQVCRMGRGRATRYARSRALPGLGTQVPIHQVDEAGNLRRYAVLHLLANGHHWLEQEPGRGDFYEGLPPFAADMSPQGYIGRSFSTRYPELELPPRIVDWTDDHRLVALARRGEDCTGDLILGEESLGRFLEGTLLPVRRGDYPEIARASAAGQTGSSAGGEQPKFVACSEGRHVLVKFAGGDDGAAARRWRDLLIAESLALEVVRAAGLQAATAGWLEVEGYCFLEVERFDRIGERGRRGLLSLGAIDDEYFGYRDSWTKAAQRLLARQWISPEDAHRLRWLDTFGQLIGNTDRHFGNISLFPGEECQLRLAPVYDMLPMLFAPVGTMVVERSFEPRPPSADNLDVWGHAARYAVEYWGRLVDSSELSHEFRQRCARCRDSMEALAARVPQVAGPTWSPG